MVFALQGHSLCIFVFGNGGVLDSWFGKALLEICRVHIAILDFIFVVLVHSHVWLRIEMVGLEKYFCGYRLYILMCWTSDY